MYCELVDDDCAWIYACPVNSRHETALRCNRIVVDLFGGKDVPYEVPMGNHGFTIISEKFAGLFKESSLSGYAVRDIVRIGTNQTGAPDPKLFLWEITGKGGHVKRFKVIGEPSTCPFCHLEPMVCPGCGRVNDPCFHCRNRTLIYPDETPGPNERRISCDFRTGPKIVEARDWEGADWFELTGNRAGGPFVNKKAKEWCEKNRIPYWTFEPALLNVEGVEDRFN
jgi:hypothetical protein